MLTNQSTALKNLLVGTPATIRVTFRDLDDQLADPTAIVVVVRDPAGNEIAYTIPVIENISVGVWELRVPTTSSGQWIVNAEASGNDIDVTTEATFFVRPSRI